jgi:uncharacterized membrane protein
MLFVLGTTVTVLAIKVIMPHFSGGKEHWAMGWYNFSSGLIGRTWQSLTNMDALKYYRDLLVPYSFLPLLALPWMLPALPDLFINLTSEHSEMKSLVFHYQSLTMVVLTIALIMAIARLKNHHEMLALGMLMLGFFTIHQNYFYSPLPTTPGHWALEYKVGENEKNFEKALAQIPKQSIVASSSEVRPHIINHKLSFNLPGGADQAEYVALVSQNRMVGDYEPKPYETELLGKLENNPKYRAIYQVQPFYLYQKIN